MTREKSSSVHASVAVCSRVRAPIAVPSSSCPWLARGTRTSPFATGLLRGGAELEQQASEALEASPVKLESGFRR
eukprot:9563320-Prorocentrum_lima.AAC.1